MKLTSIKGTVDTEKILPHIKTSQDIHIQSIIGTRLLEKCKSLIEADTLDESINSAYKTLIETYIAPCLVNYCMVDYIPFASFEISNAGIYRHTPESTTPLEMSEVSKLVQMYKDKAEFYGTRLEEFICANNSDYPEYSQTNTGDIPSSGQSTYHGWTY